jgi:hypothetical protein
VAGVRAGDRRRQARRYRQERDGDHVIPGIAVWLAVRGDLLQVQPGTVQAGLLGQLPPGGVAEVLAVAQEAAGEGELPLVRLLAPLDQQDVQPFVPDREDHEVDGDVEGGVPS